MELNPERNTDAIKIIFICDFYKQDMGNKGGAENNDSVLISLLRENGFSVETKYSRDISPIYLEDNKNKKFIIGNFIQLSEEAKHSLADKHYIIYEHDHKYVKTRDPSKFPNFKAPRSQLINESFFKNAKCVICLSDIQAECVKKNLEITNVESIGCSLWSEEKLNFISSLTNSEKQKGFCIVDSTNVVKGTSMAVEFCRRSEYEYDLISSNNENDFLSQLASYKTLIYIPTVLESLCRLVVEAKMLNCGVITKTQLLGAYSQDWWGLNGTELIDAIRAQQKTAFDIFLKHL